MSQTPPEELTPLLPVAETLAEIAPPAEPHPAAANAREALPRSERLLSRVAVVTDAAGRVGRALAIAFATEGASLTLVGKTIEEVEESARLARELGAEVLTLSGDTSSEQFCAEVIRRTLERYGDLHVLVNHAEPLPQAPSIDVLDAQAVQEVFGAIAFGGMYLVKNALPHLRAGAAIVNTAAVGAYLGDPEGPLEASARAAVLGWTRSLARRLLPREIRVNAVSPGLVWDAANEPANDTHATAAAFTPQAPSGRATTPAEVAACYVFLASPDSAAFTGQTLHPNGGEVVNG